LYRFENTARCGLKFAICNYFVISFSPILKWCNYQRVDKFDDRFGRFDMIRLCDGKTDRHPDDGICCAGIGPFVGSALMG